MGVFYTDSNGLEMQKRNTKSDTIAGNFYPVGSAIYIEDPNTKLRMT